VVPNFFKRGDSRQNRFSVGKGGTTIRAQYSRRARAQIDCRPASPIVFGPKAWAVLASLQACIHGIRWRACRGIRIPRTHRTRPHDTALANIAISRTKPMRPLVMVAAVR
jgi:hypothetical protein